MVKCSECGFLGLRVEGSTEIVAVDTDFRDTPARRRDTLWYRPICTELAYPLADEVRNLDVAYPPESDSFGDRVFEEGHTPEENVGQIIGSERDCASFRQLIPGFSPKEHREMMDRERRDAFEQQVRASDRKARRWDVVILAVVALAAGAVTAILGAVLTD